VLYQQSVQDTPTEYVFLNKAFRRLRRRAPRILREDFCGTAQMACEWVKGNRDNQAIGVDLDNHVLAWGREHNLAQLTPPQRKRLRLVEADVRTVECRAADIILAMNFSYQVFKTRAGLLEYFKHAREGLKKDGVFFIDLFGGYDAFREMAEKTDHRKFTYVWDQHRYNPITGEILCHIHFTFPDGSKLQNAFTYDWRLWTLPELQDLLYDAGFKRVTVYWQGTDPRTKDFDGVFEPATHADADPAWVAIVGAEN